MIKKTEMFDIALKTNLLLDDIEDEDELSEKLFDNSPIILINKGPKFTVDKNYFEDVYKYLFGSELLNMYLADISLFRMEDFIEKCDLEDLNYILFSGAVNIDRISSYPTIKNAILEKYYEVNKGKIFTKLKTIDEHALAFNRSFSFSIPRNIKLTDYFDKLERIIFDFCKDINISIKKVELSYGEEVVCCDENDDKIEEVFFNITLIDIEDNKFLINLCENLNTVRSMIIWKTKEIKNENIDDCEVITYSEFNDRYSIPININGQKFVTFEGLLVAHLNTIDWRSL